jgi:hypothetical protein
MNLWSVISDVFALTPEQELEYHNWCVEEGYTDPTPAEAARMEWEDTQNYLDWMPIERDVWYDGEFTGYYRYYRTDQQGHRHYEDKIYSFYAGHSGESPSYDIEKVYVGEAVEEHIPVYMRLQGEQ